MGALTKVEHWADITSCHGIKDLFQSKKRQTKLFWVAVLLAALGGMSYYQQVLIATYFSVPTATKVSIVDTDYLEFPLVTVCNDNILSRQKYLQWWDDVTPTLEYIFNGDYLGPFDFPCVLAWAPMYYYNKLYMACYPSPIYYGNAFEIYHVLFNKSIDIGPFRKYDILEMLSSVGYTCADTFPNPKDCKFSLVPFDCCANAKTIQGNMGNCFEVQPPSYDKTVSQLGAQLFPGINNGLQLTLSYNSSDALPGGVSYAGKTGFTLVVGEPMTSYDYATIKVLPGQLASIEIAQKRYVNDPAITNCVDQIDNLAFATQPTTSQCRIECIVNVTRDYLGCIGVLPNLKLNSADICSPYVAVMAFGNSNNSLIYNATFRKDITNCQSVKCPIQCDTRMYTPFTVYSRLLTKSTRTMAEVAMVNVYFSKLEYTLQVENPLWDINSVITGFGGNLSLLAGMSLITVVQFIANLVTVVADLIASCKKPR